MADTSGGHACRCRLTDCESRADSVQAAAEKFIEHRVLDDLTTAPAQARTQAPRMPWRLAREEGDPQTATGWPTDEGWTPSKAPSPHSSPDSNREQPAEGAPSHSADLQGSEISAPPPVRTDVTCEDIRYLQDLGINLQVNKPPPPPPPPSPPFPGQSSPRRCHSIHWPFIPVLHADWKFEQTRPLHMGDASCGFCRSFWGVFGSGQGVGQKR